MMFRGSGFRAEPREKGTLEKPVAVFQGLRLMMFTGPRIRVELVGEDN